MADRSSNRLRNIEMTEKAKRDMMEARKAAVVKKRPEDEDFAAARCRSSFTGVCHQSLKVTSQSSDLRFALRPIYTLSKMRNERQRDYRRLRSLLEWTCRDMRTRRMSRSMRGLRSGTSVSSSRRELRADEVA